MNFHSAFSFRVAGLRFFLHGMQYYWLRIRLGQVGNRSNLLFVMFVLYQNHVLFVIGVTQQPATPA